MTIISDYVLTSSFLCQALHAFRKKTGAYILTFCVRLDLCFVCQLCSFVFVHCETKTKTNFISYVKENGS